MLEQLTRTVRVLVERHAQGDIDVAAIVDAVFAAYGPGGIARLLAWFALTGEDRVATGLATEIGALVAVLEQLIQGADAAQRAREMVRLVASLAFADGLIGRSLSAMMGEPPEAARAEALRLLERLRQD